MEPRLRTPSDTPPLGIQVRIQPYVGLKYSRVEWPAVANRSPTVAVRREWLVTYALPIRVVDLPQVSGRIELINHSNHWGVVRALRPRLDGILEAWCEPDDDSVSDETVETPLWELLRYGSSPQDLDPAVIDRAELTMVAIDRLTEEFEVESTLEASREEFPRLWEAEFQGS